MTTGEIRLLTDRDGPECFYCDAPNGGTTVDHVVPLHPDPEGRGSEPPGADAPDNKVLACAECNSSKGNLRLALWIRRRLERKQPVTARALRRAGPLPDIAWTDPSAASNARSLARRGLTKITVTVPPEMKTAVKQAAEANSQTMSDYVTGIIAAGLDAASEPGRR